MSVRPAKTQISLGIRPVWSEYSLSAWWKLGPLATHWAHSEDSDQTGRMPRLIWVFAGRTGQFVGFVMSEPSLFIYEIAAFISCDVLVTIIFRYIFSHGSKCMSSVTAASIDVAHGIDAQNVTSGHQFCNVSNTVYSRGTYLELNLHFLNKGQTNIFYLSKFD